MSISPALWAFFLVLAPAAAAAVIVFGRLGVKAAAGWATAGSVLSVVLGGVLLAEGPGHAVLLWSWAPELFLDVSWRLETAPLALAVLVAGIGACVLQSAGSYFATAPYGPRTIALLAAFEAAMLGLVLADNLFLLYVFWELTGVCSFFLISSDPEKGEKGLRAATQALLVTVAGGLSLLVGAVLLAVAGGSARLSQLAAGELAPGLATAAFALILPAVLTKSAQVPTHFWLPGAMAAPTPVSAYLHSATMVKAGVILLLYLYPILGASPLWTWSLLPLGAVTCVWGSLRALGEPDVKLLMAWSTVSQLGLLTLTIGLGTDVAVRAATLHLFAHAVFKAGLFLTVGGIDRAAGTRDLMKLGGLRRRTPLLALVAAILAGSMAGIPPLAGFLSKELILKKAMLTDLWVHAVAIAAIVLGSAGTVAYSSRFFFEVFTGRPRGQGAATARPPAAGLLAAPLALAGVTLLAGPGARWVDRWFLEPVAASIVGRPLEALPLSLWYGVSAALLLSVGIVAAGYGVDRLLGLRFLGWRGRSVRGGAELFEAGLGTLQRTGGVFSRLLAQGPVRAYLALAVAAGLLPGLMLYGGLPSFAGEETSAAGLGVAAALAVLLTALVAARGRLIRVLLLTAVGFAVALLFRLMRGPDLMLTQLLVEVLLTLFFAFALATLPGGLLQREPRDRDRWRWGRGLVAVGAGLAAAALVPAVALGSRPEHVADYARDVAPVIAQGKNLVNVVLADLRAMDTLLETVVVTLGTLGVAGLLRGRERTDLRRSPARSEVREASGLLPGMARVILPLGAFFSLVLLLKGHNAPGGGFVAGLGFGVTAMLSLAAYGPEAVRRRLPASFGTLSVLGVLLMLAVGLAGPVAGRPFMTHFHGQLPVPGIYVPLHTTLLFDLGVVLAVAGGIGAAGTSLSSERRAGSQEASP